MRSVLALGLLLMLCASANAAPAHHARAHQPAVARPAPEVTPKARFAVPGWSDEDTRKWLDNASSLVGVGG